MNRNDILAANPLPAFLLARGVKLTGNGTRADRCPAREHSRPDAVSVDAGKGVWHCHVCGIGGSVIDWLAVEKNITPAAALKELAEVETVTTCPPAKIVATYDYQDESGVLLFQVVRLLPKSFRQRRPDPAKPGAWLWNIGDTRRVLFRLPPIIGAETVVVFEGERDVETAERFGITGTTNAGGAGKWLPSYSDALTGKAVIICGDNDEPGRKHVEAVAHSLTGKAASVRVATVPSPSKDFTEHVERFQDQESAAAAVRALLESAAPWTPAAPSNVTHGQQIPPATVHDAIILPGSGVTITATASELFPRIAKTRTMFTRGGAVCVTRRNESGLLELEIVRPAAARSLLERYGDFMAWRSGGDGENVLKPVVMPEDMARALLESELAREHLPPIAGLVNCPVMFGDGDIAGPGYHAPSGLLITGGKLPPTVPTAEAVASLLGLLAEFAFQSPADLSRAVASIITPALKLGGHIRGNVPADCAEADKSQSGKTYRQKILAAIYNERSALVTSRAGGVGSTDESFNSQLIAARYQ